MSSSDDSILVSRYKEGDSSAFDELVHSYWDRIFARSQQLLRNRQDAEEVTQDTFIRARKGLENYRGDAAFSTWLFQIATNLAHNRYWYWFRRRRDASLPIDEPVYDEGLKLEEVLPSGEVGPSQEAQTNELVNRINECMEELEETQREILYLRNVEHLSYQEIADKLDLNVGTVKSRIARARDALRVKMGREFA